MAQRRGLHKITETVDGESAVITYRFLGQLDGRGYFAEVSLRNEAIPQARPIIFSGQEFAWIKEAYGPDAREWPDSDDFRQAVVFGIQYALLNCREPGRTSEMTLTVLKIGATVVDTTLETVSYVAALATWKILGLEPLDEPYIEQHQVHFPGRKPELPSI